MKKLVTSPYFPYVYLFVIICCFVAILFLPPSNPLFIGSVVLGLLLFFLSIYRRMLGRRR
ncbi:hypothetical protein [Olivibacter sitiensis]|uniref:hypothetical protein n=1 Tax=Olivibacter sitiensis TaxID=376470 RepID=UPI000421D55B|nr:hypothetical protein [Olivibacter sitiensis]